MPFPSTSFRLDPALLARVDAYAAQLAQETGIPVSSTAALAKLLSMALDQVEPPTQLSERERERLTSKQAQRVAAHAQAEAARRKRSTSRASRR